jgi:putative sigma-54 modulation protein
LSGAADPSLQEEQTMQVNISGHHVDVTDALNDYIGQKLERLERHFDQIGNVQITLSVEKQRQKADYEHEDLYAAIDLMADKLDRQLLKHKEKTVDRMHGNSR